MSNLTQHLTGLDATKDNVFIPAITGRHICSADERLLLFSVVADLEFANSLAATEQLVEHVSNQESTAPVDSEKLKISRRRIANTREELSNTILHPTAAQREDEPRTTRGKRPGKDKGCLELVNNIAIKVRELQPEQKGILRCAQP